MKYEELQAALAKVAKQEAALRDERKRLEDELATAKIGRPFGGPVTDADGQPVEAAIEGVTATAAGVGKAVN